MVVVTLSAIVVQIEELQTRSNRASGNASMEPAYIWVADFLFVLFTLVELTLKVLLGGGDMN